MYTANSPKELKKLMEEDKFPIQVADEETKGIVEILESLKSKGVLPTAKDEIKKVVIAVISASQTTINIICPSTNDTSFFSDLALLATITALYALYKRKNIKLQYGPGGPVLTTGD